MAIPFVPDDAPAYGAAVRLHPLITRVTARNPSRFTFRGTGTYLVGDEAEVAIIDPGPALDEHLDALVAAVDGRAVTAIIVTHSHTDHCGLARRAAERFGAPTVGFGRHHRSGGEWPNEAWPQFPLPPEVEAELRAEIAATGTMIEEGTDDQFTPETVVADGAVAGRGAGWTLRAVHTPGHTSNHLCLWLDELGALFTGDHVMSWSTTVVSPPDGDMGQYLHSLQRVIDLAPTTLYPTHGAPVTDPAPFLRAYLAHRGDRERQVVASLADGVDTLAAMVPTLYAAVHPVLFPAAARSLFAHVIQLVDEGRVEVLDGGALRPLARFGLVER